MEVRLAVGRRPPPLRHRGRPRGVREPLRSPGHAPRRGGPAQEDDGLLPENRPGFPPGRISRPHQPACAGAHHGRTGAAGAGPGGLRLMAMNLSVDNMRRASNRFWSGLHASAYGILDDMPRVDRLRLLREFIVMLWSRRHLGAVETPVGDLAGKRVLDLGCGAGAHTAMFRYYGADVAALDLSPVRARASSGILPGPAVCADMRHLPFRDGSFDFVYSNGVIHHAPDERGTVREILRVLKPGGGCAVMVYAKHSFLYWCVLFPVRGVMHGGLWREGNWLGRATEWLPRAKQTVFNPYTSVFTEDEVRALFSGFREVHVRKSGFVFEQVPIVGKTLGRIVGRWTGYNEGGILAYGRPWRNETRLELWLGGVITSSGLCGTARSCPPSGRPSGDSGSGPNPPPCPARKGTPNWPSGSIASSGPTGSGSPVPRPTASPWRT